MKILGRIRENILIQMIFKIILVLFITFTAIKLGVITLVENISGVSEHRRENLERLKQSLTGNAIMDLVQNSKKM
jgi:hypothetical protein